MCRRQPSLRQQGGRRGSQPGGRRGRDARRRDANDGIERRPPPLHLLANVGPGTRLDTRFHSFCSRPRRHPHALAGGLPGSRHSSGGRGTGIEQGAAVRDRRRQLRNERRAGIPAPAVILVCGGSYRRHPGSFPAPSPPPPVPPWHQVGLATSLPFAAACRPGLPPPGKRAPERVAAGRYRVRHRHAVGRLAIVERPPASATQPAAPVRWRTRRSGRRRGVFPAWSPPRASPGGRRCAVGSGGHVRSARGAGG